MTSRDTTSFRTYDISENRDAVSFRHEDWYTCPVPRKTMKALMKRDDRKALMNYGSWLILLAASGVVAFHSWNTWFAVPAFFVYGVLYASAAESRLHECLHRTPFKSLWLNEIFLHVAGFMSLKNCYLWRWSHTRHHTDTIIVGRDPEIAYPRPPDVWGMVLNLLHLRAGITEVKKTARQCFGRLTESEKDFVPDIERPKVIALARIHMAVFVAIGALAVTLESWLPIMFIGLPTFYGSWLHSLLSATQHAGLAEDVPDHRHNSRTIYLNPVLRFIYSNMNYHLEHHMFPMVPFHSLPALHEEIKSDCPPAYPSLWAALREMGPALKAQLTDPHHFVPRDVPAGRSGQQNAAA